MKRERDIKGAIAAWTASLPEPEWKRPVTTGPVTVTPVANAKGRIVGYHVSRTVDTKAIPGLDEA